MTSKLCQRSPGYLLITIVIICWFSLIRSLLNGPSWLPTCLNLLRAGVAGRCCHAPSNSLYLRNEELLRLLHFQMPFMCRLLLYSLCCSVNSHCSKFRSGKTEASVAGPDHLVAGQPSYSRFFINVFPWRACQWTLWSLDACPRVLLPLAFVTITILSSLPFSAASLHTLGHEEGDLSSGLCASTTTVPGTQRCLSRFSIWYSLHSALSVSGWGLSGASCWLV